MKTFFGSIISYVNFAVEAIFIGYPVRTSLGILFGLFIKVILHVFSPMLSELQSINLSTLSEWEFIVVGVSIFHIRTFIYQLRNNNMLDENVEKAFEVIRLGKTNGHLNEWQTRNMYQDLCQKVLDNIELKDNVKDEMRNRLG